MIYDEIKEDRLLKPKDRAQLAVIMNEITVDGKPMNDKDAIKKLTQMKKACVKNIAIYGGAGRADMFDKEVGYMKLIECYLPAGATREKVIETIETLGIEKNMKSMGKLMSHLKKEYEVVDGNLVKDILMGK